jgi:hypothetical protein
MIDLHCRQNTNRTLQLGIHKILGDKAPLKIIRDLLFSSSINPKRRSFFVFEVSTRALMLDVLCTLASLQTQGQAIYVHGYDILQQLLLDTPEDLALQAQEDDEKPVNRVSHYPFPMTLKEAKEHETGDAEPNNSPRYTAWMRELAFTVDKSIEPITFLAQVLDYRFESAFKQLKIQPDANNANWKQAVNEQIAKDPSANPVQAGGSVMVDEGVVDYLVSMSQRDAKGLECGTDIFMPITDYSPASHVYSDYNTTNYLSRRLGSIFTRSFANGVDGVGVR